MQTTSLSPSPASDSDLIWPLSPDNITLAENEVHVWSAWLFRPDFDYDSALATLSDDERLRAQKFQVEYDRRLFLTRRSLLRVILGSYLNQEPSQVALHYELLGKPRLAEPPGARPLHFNLSHSRNLALYAVTRLAPLGVDVEKIRAIPEMSEIAGAFFSPAEKELFDAAQTGRRCEVFFDIWTRKEACLKATGEGIATALADLDCSRAPAHGSLHTLSPAPGFTGALALGGVGAKLLCRQWSWP